MKENEKLRRRVSQLETALEYLEAVVNIRNCPKCDHETLQSKGVILSKEGEKSFWSEQIWHKADGFYQRIPWGHGALYAGWFSVPTDKCLNCGALIQERQERVVVPLDK